MVKCPKCGRGLTPSGHVIDDSKHATDTYQCPECLRTVSMFGESTEIALTFVLDNDGRPIDPADPDADLAR